MWWDILNTILNLKDKIRINRILIDKVDESVVITIVVNDADEASTLYRSLSELLDKYGDIIGGR